MCDAVLAESEEAVKALVSLPGVRDDPGEDGLTGFAIALGLMNSALSLFILRSNVEPRDDIIFLANEVLHVNPDGDARILRLQNSIKKALEQMNLQGSKLSEKMDPSPRTTNGELMFPMINDNIEKQERYFKNKNWQKQNLEDNLDRSRIHNEIEADVLEPLILDKFCIEAETAVKWAIQEVKIVPCTHEGNR